MRLGRVLPGFLIAVLLAGCHDGPPTLTSPSVNFNETSATLVTVVGQNDPSVDIAAVQNAVDNYDLVTLSGTFDFGFDETIGGVEITRSGVAIEGPASISGIGQYGEIPELPGYWFLYLLSVEAPGVRVHDLELNSYYDTGILVHALGEETPIEIEGNSIYGWWASIFSGATQSELEVTNNYLASALPFGGCYFATHTEGGTKVSHNRMECANAVRIYPFNHRLDISHNTAYVNGGDGVWIGSWSVMNETEPEWGDNPPVKIFDNVFHMSSDWSAGVMIGTSAHGVSNAIVEGNTFTGEADYGGLTKQPYGHNNTFLNNDLTALKTYSPQIWLLGGSNNRFLGNRLGEVDAFWAGSWGPALADAAALVSTVNWHLNDWRNTPDPVNHNNHFAVNDYTLTGVPGWTSTSEGAFGAVLLLDFIQKFTEPDLLPYEEPFVMQNRVAELGRFPEGTDVCSQVKDLSNRYPDDLLPGTNSVAGWQPCEVRAGSASPTPHAGIAAAESVRERRAEFGEWLKSMMENRMEMERLWANKPPRR